MSDVNNVQDNQDGGQAPNSDPGKSDAGQSQQTIAQSDREKNIPDNLKGKSVEDLAQMYSELEKKLGDQSNELGEKRKFKEQMDVVLKVIQGDPELFEKTEKALRKLNGQPDYVKGDRDTKEEKKQPDDVRQVTQNRIISEFQEKVGLDKVDSSKKSEILKKVSNELADMVDPSGEKTIKEVFESIRLDKLGPMLEKAYWLVYKESIQSGDEDLDSLFGALGRMPSSGGSGGSNADGELTKEELNVAKKLGLTSEQYAKRKKEING